MTRPPLESFPFRCSDNCSARLAEADARTIVTATPTAQRDSVAVLEERARRAVGEVQRLGAAPGQLDEAAALALRRAADGPRGEQIAGARRGAVDGHVCELLGERPVHLLEI